MSGDEGVAGTPDDGRNRPEQARDQPFGATGPRDPRLPQSQPDRTTDSRPRIGDGGLLAAEVVNAVTGALMGLLIVYWLAQFLGLDENSWILVLVWIVSGLVVLWRGLDDVLARYLYGLRRPILVESQRLAPSWFGVARRAGIDPVTFSQWIQVGESPTADGGSGRTITVTAWAINTIPPSHLEAVMAHNFVSHLRGGTRLARLALWYSVPMQLVRVGLRKLLKLSRTVPAVGCTIVGFLVLAYAGIFLFVLVFYDGWLIPILYLSPLLLPVIFSAMAKWTERMADRAAADLGYGRLLLEVFYGWQAQHQEEHRRLTPNQPDWMGGQPAIAERIRALEVYVQRA